MKLKNFLIYLVSFILVLSNCKSDKQLEFLQDFQDYNMYVFSIQMTTTLCLTSPKVCEDKMETVPKNVMTIHGLWPSVIGEKLEDCNTGDQIDVIIKDEDLQLKMQQYWPSLKGGDKSFWDHEYNKHGYCWVQKYEKDGPEDFFGMTMALYEKKGLDKIILNGGFEIEPGTQSFDYDDLRDKLSGVVAHNFDMHCTNYNHKQYLIDIYIYLDLDFESLDSHVGTTSCNKSKPINLIFR